MERETWLQNKLTIKIFIIAIVISAIQEIYFGLTSYILDKIFQIFLTGIALLIIAFLVSIIVQIFLCRKEKRSFSEALLVIILSLLSSLFINFFIYYLLGALISLITG